MEQNLELIPLQIMIKNIQKLQFEKIIRILWFGKVKIKKAADMEFLDKYFIQMVQRKDQNLML